MDSILPPWKWQVEHYFGFPRDSSKHVPITIIVRGRREASWTAMTELNKLQNPMEQFQKLLRIIRFKESSSNRHRMLKTIYATDQDIVMLIYLFLRYGQNVQELNVWHSICVARLGGVKSKKTICRMLGSSPAIAHLLNPTIKMWARFGGFTNKESAKKFPLHPDDLRKIYISRWNPSHSFPSLPAWKNEDFIKFIMQVMGSNLKVDAEAIQKNENGYSKNISIQIKNEILRESNDRVPYMDSEAQALFSRFIDTFIDELQQNKSSKLDDAMKRCMEVFTLSKQKQQQQQLKRESPTTGVEDARTAFSCQCCGRPILLLLHS